MDRDRIIIEYVLLKQNFLDELFKCNILDNNDIHRNNIYEISNILEELVSIFNYNGNDEEEFIETIKNIDIDEVIIDRINKLREKTVYKMMTNIDNVEDTKKR